MGHCQNTHQNIQNIQITQMHQLKWQVTDNKITKLSQVRQHVDQNEAIIRLIVGNRVQSEIQLLQLRMYMKTVQLLQAWDVIVISNQQVLSRCFCLWSYYLMVGWTCMLSSSSYHYHHTVHARHKLWLSNRWRNESTNIEISNNKKIQIQHFQHPQILQTLHRHNAKVNKKGCGSKVIAAIFWNQISMILSRCWTITSKQHEF